MARLNDREFIGELQELFQRKEGMKEFLETVIEKAMNSEIDTHLDAVPYERTKRRKGYRNGKKPRSFKTRVGELNLEVPQSRGCEPYHPSMFNKWQRSERALLVACAEMYFQGVSTRKVQKVLDVMGGMELSAGQISRIASELDEKISVFRSSRLDAKEYPYLIIDARYEKIRRNGHIISQGVLIITGINSEGHREVLDWLIADTESEDTWGDLFKNLKDRGLQGVQLITSDKHKGIISAMKRHFQGVLWQRCRVHYKRELAKKVGWKLRKDLMRDIRQVFLPEEKQECMIRAEEMASHWEKTSHKVASMLRNDFESCLTVCGLPSGHRRKLNSTNMIERIMEELKRRTRVVGIFPNRASCDRLIGAQLLEIDEKWQTEKKRYLDMEVLENPEYKQVFEMSNEEEAVA